MSKSDNKTFMEEEKSDYYRGYEEIYDEAYEKGYEDGLDRKDRRKKRGDRRSEYAEGRTDGWNDGYEEGYNDGKRDRKDRSKYWFTVLRIEDEIVYEVRDGLGGEKLGELSKEEWTGETDIEEAVRRDLRLLGFKYK